LHEALDLLSTRVEEALSGSVVLVVSTRSTQVHQEGVIFASDAELVSVTRGHFEHNAAAAGSALRQAARCTPRRASRGELRLGATDARRL